MKHLPKISLSLLKSPRRLLMLFAVTFTMMVGAANVVPFIAPTVYAGTTASVPEQSENDTTGADCASEWSNPFSWVMCPVFDAMSGGAEFLFQNVLQPLLVTVPVSTDSNNPSFQIWSSFRIYGNIFLIIALLVVVFGQSIGGGLVDAYTAKKVLPRILAAAILINLSIYIVAFAVDVTNIVGKGLGQLMTAPIAQCEGNDQGSDCWVFDLSVADGGRVFAVGLVGLLASGPALTGVIGSILGGGVAGAPALGILAILILLPVILAVIAIFLTLIIRQGLIIILIMLAPVAFALYCLPNTEKYFRKWWELLTQALLVYPIIVAIFGAADLLAVTLLQANNITPSNIGQSNFFANNVGATVALVVAFLAQFVPLLLIPFSFRFAGGIMKRAYEAATTAGGKVGELAEGRRKQAKVDYGSRSLAARARAYHKANEIGAKAGRIPIAGRGLKGASRMAAKTAGGYNIEALMSAARAEKTKQLEDQIATGRDEEIRGLTVNKARALEGRGAKAVKNADGSTSWVDKSTGTALSGTDLAKYDYREGADGITEFQSLGGAWVSEQDVDSGHSRWGRDQYAQQAALSYEMRKGLTDDNRARIKDKFMDTATSGSGWGMTDSEAKGMWIGSAFANQGTNLEYKYTKHERNSDGKATQKFDHEGYTSEVFEKRGSYAMSNMDASSIRRLSEAWDKSAGNPEQRKKLAAVAETMRGQRMAAEQGQPIVAEGEGGQGQMRSSSMGAGHVSQAMDEFVTKALGSQQPRDPNQGTLI